MSDMLFINYAVPPDRIRALVPSDLELDTISVKGLPTAYVSTVPFKVVDVRSTNLRIPGFSFEQINYRTYVRTDEGAAAYFFEMKVDSRMIVGASTILNLPVSYQSIEITTRPHRGDRSVPDTTDMSEQRMLLYTVEGRGDEGLAAEVIVGPESEPDQLTGSADFQFITQRPLGFVSSSAGGLMRIAVEHPMLEGAEARPVTIRAPFLEGRGILLESEAGRPHSIYYVRDAVFGTNPPAPWLRDD